MNNNKLQAIYTLNDVCMAYFQNILVEEGINLLEMKSEFPDIERMRHNFFVPDVNYAYMKDMHCGKVLIMNKDLSDILNKKIYDYFDDSFKDGIKKSAIELSETIKKHPNSDIVFSQFLGTPFLSICSSDSETNFTSRIIYRRDILDNCSMFIFEYCALLMDKYIKCEDKSPHGQTWVRL